MSVASIPNEFDRLFEAVQEAERQYLRRQYGSPEDFMSKTTTGHQMLEALEKRVAELERHMKTVSEFVDLAGPRLPELPVKNIVITDENA